MDILNGETPAQDPAGSRDADVKARLAAQLEAFKSTDPARVNPPVPQAATTAETQAQPTAPEKAQPEAAQPKQNEEGEVDPQLAKEEKINESLGKKVQDKEARIQQILRQREELKKQLYAKGREAAALEKQPMTPQEFNGLTPELKQQFLADLEKDPVGAIFKAAEIVAETRFKLTQEELAKLRQDDRTRKEAERLDSLGQAGHPWVYTSEGQQWFQEKFQEEPGLLQMSDPYGAAVRMFSDDLPKSAQQPANARAARGTPVLGAASAVPPPSSTPAVAPEKKLSDLNLALQQAIAIGDRKEQQRLGMEMRRIAAGIEF